MSGAAPRIMELGYRADMGYRTRCVMILTGTLQGAGSTVNRVARHRAMRQYVANMDAFATFIPSTVPGD